MQRGALAPDCSPAGFGLDVGNPSFPRRLPREVEGLHLGGVFRAQLGQARLLPASFGRGAERPAVPRDGCVAQRLHAGNAHPPSLGAGSPKNTPGTGSQGHRPTTHLGSCGGAQPLPRVVPPCCLLENQRRGKSLQNKCSKGISGACAAALTPSALPCVEKKFSGALPAPRASRDKLAG